MASGNHDGDLHRPPAIAAREAAGRDPGRLRIALSWKAAFTFTPKPLHPDVRAAVTGVARTLARLGHFVEEAEPDYGLVGLAFVPRATAGVGEWADRVPDRSLLDRRTREAARMGRLLGGPLLRRARAVEKRQQRRIGALFGPYDVLLTPTTATPPPRIGTLAKLSGWRTDQAMIAACPYAWPWNVLGWPGVSVPAGFSSDGLPLGAQLLGPAHGEPRLISLAAQLQDDLRWHERRPAAHPASPDGVRL